MKVHIVLKDILTLAGSQNTYSPNCTISVAIILKYVFAILQHNETVKQVVIIRIMILCPFKVLHSYSQNFPSILVSQASLQENSMYLGF